jgi:CzcA family heavy metal efflux pump
MGRARDVSDLARGVVRVQEGLPLRVSDLGQVRIGSEPTRGTASYRGKPAVVLSIQKQPGANTLDLTREMDRVLAELTPALPPGMRIEKENFRQADFIEVAVRNVARALRDGAFLVILILALFLGNVRTTVISALAIPLSLVAGILLVRFTGGTINTMTLGGLTIAIGALVDDAIIDVENVFRRLRENRRLPEPERRPALEVVFRASSEVRQAIFFATLIIAVVFLPVVFLPGLEGRLLRPLAGAYVAALAASLLVSLTVTPVLCRILLPNSRALDRQETPVMRGIRRLYAPTLDAALGRPRLVLAGVLILVLGATAALPFLGRSFLPPFNEGSLTVSVVSAPGITLEESDRLGRQVERTLLSFPETVSTSRRTGRAEKDEHVQGVNASEMEVVLRPGRPKEQLLAEMRTGVATIPGVSVSFGQPISHRIDHMISGSKSNLAVKVFGPDLSVLRNLAGAAQRTLAAVPGVTDLSNTEQAPVPQLLVDFDRDALARYGLSTDAMARSIEALFQGTAAGEIATQGIVSRVVVRFPEGLRSDPEHIGALPVTTPSGEQVRLDEVARLRFELGPSMVRRESVERVAMLSANLEGADLAGGVARVRRALDAALPLPAGYRLTLGGQFEEAERGLRTLLLLSVVLLAAIGGLLYVALGDHRHAAIVLINLPLALIGGVFAVALSDRVLSIAATVGFITLFGIATRNGVLLVSHYQHLMREDGLPLSEAVRRGSLERLAPVLMTALTAALALIPLIWAGAEPGNEIQSPMARVILGGLLTSTFLNMIVVPVLFMRWGGGDRGASHVGSRDPR